MKKVFLLAIVFLGFIQLNQAQSRYIVRFKNKGTNPFSLSNPSQYLSSRALQRRTRYNIAIDSADLPVTPRFVDSVRLAGAVTILNTSKWLNEVAIQTTDPVALAKINTFPFVVSAVAVANRNTNDQNTFNKFEPVIDAPIYAQAKIENTAGAFSYGIANGQVKLHQGEFLHDRGYRGEGMQIGVLDAGFYHYLSLPTFDSIRNNNQIINTWDFVANNASVDEDHTHGMQCLSAISANMPGVFVGTAPKASFCLYRTEDVASETKLEEHNLAAGFERADSIGVDVCSVSLGYSTFDNAAQNYNYANMDGNTTMSAIAADLAAKKGMLPVIAAGNDGASPWHYIITPGDADSVLTVGAVDTLSNVASFSAYGPSSNGRIKPDLAAVGRSAIVASPSTGLPSFGNGTSFATPNLAGLTTCLWQAFPEFNNMAILDAMKKSATTYTNPNDRIGYGIPSMKKAFTILLQKSFTSSSNINNCAALVNMNVKFDNSMKVVIERKMANQASFTTLTTINGTGAFTNKAISFTDDLTNQSSGITNYRVRLDIGTDTSFYLTTLNITVPSLCSNPIDEIKISPNPTSDNINVIVSRAVASKIDIAVINSAGQNVYNTTYQQASGSVVNTINLKQVSPGIYIVKVLANNKTITTQRILKN